MIMVLSKGVIGNEGHIGPQGIIGARGSPVSESTTNFKNSKITASVMPFRYKFFMHTIMQDLCFFLL